MSTGYDEDNARARDRLFAVTERLTDVDMDRVLASGWTVRTVLVHLAYWDRFTQARMEDWELNGFEWFPTFIEGVNDTIEFISRAIPRSGVVDLVRSAAEGADRKVAAIPPDLVGAIEAAGHNRMLRRASHRDEHLDQIEAALGA